jgi:tryptophan synthase alpha chain
MMRRLEAAGALALEIGVPFSDPIADGPEIQRASEWALRHGKGPLDALQLVSRYRSTGALPVIVMTYANPVLRLGAEAFAARARECGVDAVILTDVPTDELSDLWQAFDHAEIDTVVLVAPTTPEERLPAVLVRARGFVYCLSRTGVTGRSAGYTGSLEQRLAAIRRHTRLPIALGFGIATGDQARALRGSVEAIVVGAAFTRAVASDPSAGASDRVESLARELVAALR